jgi:hypothetical protein
VQSARLSEDGHPPAKDLQELCYAVVMLCFIDETVKDVVDLLPDVCSEPKKFPINTMEDSLEEISLPGIFRIEEL